MKHSYNGKLWPQRAIAMPVPSLTSATNNSHILLGKTPVTQVKVEHISCWVTTVLLLHFKIIVQLTHHQLLQLRVVHSQTSLKYLTKTSCHFDPTSNTDTFCSAHPSPTMANNISTAQTHFSLWVHLLNLNSANRLPTAKHLRLWVLSSTPIKTI